MRGIQLAQRIGLTLEQCRRTVEPIECVGSLPSVENLLENKFGGRNATMIIWQINKITWCRVLDGRIVSNEELKPANWLEWRVFDRDGEIHAKRSGDGFIGRYVFDEQGDETYFADSFSRFWGEAVESSDGVRLLDRQRKLEINLPVEPSGAKWYGLLTRNYIGSDASTGLSGYVDYRFVAIEPAEGGADIGLQ